SPNNTPCPRGLLPELFALVLGFHISVAWASTADSVPRAPGLLAANRPLVIGHRGYPEFAPENTLPSFDMATRAGADLVELDYHHSKDNVPIVIHDDTLDRTTDATNRLARRKIAVSSLAVHQLKQLDAGAWFSPKYAGTRLPLLSEALELIQGSQGTTLIERKSGDPATLLYLLREKSMLNSVVIQSFDWQFLIQVHSIEPTQILGALGPPARLPDGSQPTRSKALDDAWLELLAPTGAKVVVWNRELSPQAVEAAHRRGLKVWVYTINQPDLAQAMFDIGVDGIITDNPSLVWRVLALRCEHHSQTASPKTTVPIARPGQQPAQPSSRQ
ncbi:MAG: glycerophosphodiester phosphodiesterase family protein, partial [Verrucomicrobiae bacterium]|nr:glycerophosphodiester phosphodiesterase family protein [Verrucomicrobiae bacterium]